MDYKNESVWLMKGDCLERMKEIPSGSIDMVLADPPYGTTACKWDSIIPLEPMWKQLKRVIKPNGAIVMTASQPFTSFLICSNTDMFKYCWVWKKSKPTGHLNAKKQPLRTYEDVVVFYGNQCIYNPQGVKPTDKVVSRTNRGNYGECSKTTRQTVTNYPRNIVEFPSVDGVHQTQKPVALMEYLIKTYTNEGETVLDFTAGSFTTGVACVNLNRKFIGIEMNKEYFDIGVNRIKERIKCQNLKIETGGKYGRLTVMSHAGKDHRGKHLWLCLCDCGNEKVVVADNMSSGKSNSCGCLKAEFLSRKGNQYGLYDDREKALLMVQYSHLKRRDKNKGFSETLSFDVFSELSKSPCKYCGLEYSKEIEDRLHESKKQKRLSDHVLKCNGIDRIDSSKGYSVENSVACCKYCNTAKNTMSESEFYRWIRMVYEFNF